VEWNHGTFEVLSLPEGGTRCTVHLSAFPDALDSELHHRTGPGDRRERRFGEFGPKDRAVLLVEDDPDVRELLRAALARTGHPVVTADDGITALERLLDRDERPIALIVTDVVMPRMGGYALAQYAAAVIPDINVVFITGYRDREAPAGGVVLQKPFSPEALFALVTEKLEAS
jgi:CheY-like chemotaxis protein